MIKKALSGTFLSLVVGFVTQWLNLLRHVPYLVHPDWENQAGQADRHSVLDCSSHRHRHRV